MSDSVQFSITGLAPLLAKLESVSHDMKRKGGRFALRKAAQVVEKALKQNAARVDDPKSPAYIPANVAIRWSSRRFKRTGDLGFRVGILGGAGGSAKTEKLQALPGKDTRHWRFIEMGTEKMRAQPFMRQSLEQNINPATNEFVTQYQKALDRAIKRAAKGK